MARKRLKSAAGAAEDQLKAGAKRLRGQLVSVEKAAEKLATKAKERLPAASEVKPDLPGVRRRLKKASSSVSKRKRPAPPAEPSTQPSTEPSTAPAAASATAPSAAPRTAPAPAPSATSGPDASWTVADLRAEAKRRGLTGYSRKTKAELLAELRG